MESRKERIRKAVKRVLKEPIESQTDLGNTFDKANEAFKMIERGELPNRIIGKVPMYHNFIREFIYVFATKDKEALIQLVLSNKVLVYDDMDFIVYLTFIIKRQQKLGQKEQADVTSMLMEEVIKIGLLYG